MREFCFDPIESVLCVGAHSDDIEIGCGGTLLQMLAKRPELKVHWVVFSGNAQRESEARRSANAFLRQCENKTITTYSFRDAYFPAQWEEIKQRFGELREQCDPDLVFTHRLEDRHQDHQIVSQLTWNHFRNHAILEYEIPKYEGDLVTPSVYVPLQPEIATTKVDLLSKHFASQQSKPWYDTATFEALMRIRGLESGASSQRAEAFIARKLLLQV
ncbi:MAG: PIG-L deacetylase family protein [Planctomycetota bacterium]